jgi:hypothetical protein
MNWTEMITGEVEHTYKTTQGLLDLVDANSLGWKPAEGSNWMTTGQLLMHLTSACGQMMKGFVTGDWGMPPDVDPSSLPPEEMLPPAEKLPAIKSVAEAKALLEADRVVALEMIRKAGEADLNTKPAAAPWDPRPVLLGPRLLQMTEHLKQHKAQLFYYLKLQGKPVHTGNLWGM